MEKDLETTIELAEKEIAKLQLDDESVNINTVALDSAYINAKTRMSGTMAVMQDSMYLAEEIVGYHGRGSASIPYEVRSRLNTTLYVAAENDLQEASELYGKLKSDTQEEEIDAAILATREAANSVSVLLIHLGGELQKISYYGAVIDTYIVKVTTQSTTLTTSLSALNEVQKNIQDLKTGAEQDTETLILNYQLQIDAAQNAYTTAVNSLDKAKFNLKQSKINAENSNNNAEAQIEIREAALNASKASLELKRAPVRATDLAPLLAQISLANVALEIANNEYKDSQLIAPISGQVTFINGKVGEQISLSGTSLKSFLTIQADNLIVEANVPETDVSKVNPGDKVEMTVDAFDFTQKFQGTVAYVDPAETIIQGVVYYQIKAAFDLKDERLKSGMTTNLDVVTDSKDNVLIIPARAIKYEDSTRYVEVLNNGTPKKTYIKTGLESDQFVEVTEGLKERDKIITFTK